MAAAASAVPTLYSQKPPVKNEDTKPEFKVREEDNKLPKARPGFLPVFHAITTDQRDKKLGQFHREEKAELEARYLVSEQALALKTLDERLESKKLPPIKEMLEKLHQLEEHSQINKEDYAKIGTKFFDFNLNQIIDYLVLRQKRARLKKISDDLMQNKTIQETMENISKITKEEITLGLSKLSPGDGLKITKALNLSIAAGNKHLETFIKQVTLLRNTSKTQHAVDKVATASPSREVFQRQLESTQSQSTKAFLDQEFLADSPQPIDKFDKTLKDLCAKYDSCCCPM